MMTTVIAAVLVSVVLRLIGADVEQWLRWLASRIVRREAAKLPRLSTRMEEQWLADLDEMPGTLAKLYYAVRLMMRHGALVETVPSEETPAPQVLLAGSPTITFSAPPATLSLTGHAPTVVIRPVGASIQDVPFPTGRTHPAFMSIIVEPLLPLRAASSSDEN